MSDETRHTDAQTDTGADAALNSQTDETLNAGAMPYADTVDTTGDHGQPNGETNQTDEAAQDGASEDGTVTPGDYADFTFPDGMEVDDRLVDSFQNKAKDLNLTQEQAQSLVDLYTGQVASAYQAQADAHETKVERWAEEAMVDKEFGGDGLEKNLGIAKTAIDANSAAADLAGSALDRNRVGQATPKWSGLSNSRRYPQ